LSLKKLFWLVRVEDIARMSPLSHARMKGVPKTCR
jgi:hypothetical protein